MTDLVDLLTRAADAAGKAAAKAAVEDWYTRDDIEQEGLRFADAVLIAASGPDHWRAVEATLRAAIKAHPAYHHGHAWRAKSCAELGWTTCQWIESLRRLAEQVLRDLAPAVAS
jgi:ABC-type Fe3+-hydroxamate transport system substrate-binding protein